MEDGTTRLEGIGEHQGGWRATPFGDPLEYKCITMYCVYFNEGAPEDSYYHGPFAEDCVWVYTTKEDADAAAAKLNKRVKERRMYRGDEYEVHIAAIIQHGREDEAEIWLREQGLIEE